MLSVPDQLLTPFLDHRAKFLANLIAPHVEVSDHILDLGAGNMLISQRIQNATHAQVIGVDVLDMNRTNLPCRIYDGKTIPLKDKSVDKTMMIGVLHHIKNQEVVLREVQRVTRGEVIIFEDVYRNWLEYQWVKVRDVLGNLPEEPRMNFALNFHKTDEWTDLFTSLGWKIKFQQELFLLTRLTRHVLISASME